MNGFNSIDILANAWVFAGIWVAALVAATFLHHRHREAPATLLVLPILATLHFGGWFDLTVLTRTEGLRYWGGAILYFGVSLGYAFWCGYQEIQENVRLRIGAQKAWFTTKGLPYNPERLVVPESSRQDYIFWKQGEPIFNSDRVEDWYSQNKMKLFWWAYFFPIDLIIHLFDRHLKAFFMWLIELPILRYPFEIVSSYHYDAYDLQFRELLQGKE